jgi:tetratricopeptide (TPR) repeat protein
MTEAREKVQGIYFRIKVSTIGTGATQQQVCTKIFCEATEIEGARVAVRYLGFNGKPSGIVEEIEKDAFVKDFVFDSGRSNNQDDPKERSLEKHIAMGDDHLRKREYFAAEYEYNNALRLDEDNVRAVFGKGLSLMERGDEAQAKEVFTRLARIEALFHEKNKHLFNEFGIRLRKLGMCDEAIRHYQKAITICPDDEHLYFNMARACFEKKDNTQARKWIRVALKANPNFQEAKNLLHRMDGDHPPDSED